MRLGMPDHNRLRRSLHRRKDDRGPPVAAFSQVNDMGPFESTAQNSVHLARPGHVV